MCGISGFIDYSKKTPIETLQAMMQSLYHRGPDGNGLELATDFYATIGMAHNRLSIIDLSDLGKQPMKFNELCITFNGEIYNFGEIKSELIQLGHVFISGTDTEVILHAYKQWGASCLQRFIGMFAFVIYDAIKGELICVRDRAGVKPFYYYWHNDLFLFASELKAFHCHSQFKKEINMEAVSAFFQYGNVPSNSCIFKFCHKIKPGHYLLFKLKKKEIEEHKYWDVSDFYNKPKLDVDFDEAKNKTEKLLQSAFKYRLVSDVPVGIFLSGGYDSTLLTGILQKESTQKLNTFTIGVSDDKLNEAPYAKKIAEYIGTNHSEFICTQKDALEVVKALPEYFDEPFADSSAIPSMLVSKMAKESVKVVLSADGGDEIFAGYNKYDYLMNQHNMITKTPKFLRTTALEILSGKLIGKMFGKPGNTKLEKTISILKDLSTMNFMHNINVLFTKDDLSRLLLKPVNEHISVIDMSAIDANAMSPLSLMMMVDYKMYLPDDIMQKVDRSSMSQSIEAREPYLDHRIIEFVSQLPDNYKYHRGIKKHLLKEICYRYVPKKLVDRPKMGFTVPIEDWLREELKEIVIFYLGDARIKRQGLFSSDEIQKIMKAFYNDKKQLANKIWYLLMFQMWYEKWMIEN